MHNISHALRRAELIAADSEGFVCGDARMTFGEFVARPRRLGTVLADLGVERGGRVAVISLNSIPHVELYSGVPASGRVVVPLNFRWADAELQYALEDSGARVLFIDRDPGALAELVDTVVRLDTDDYDNRIAAAAETDFDPALTADDLAGLFYTGGTTGASKGVMLSHRNLVAHAYNTQMLIPLEPGDSYQVIAPLFHAAGSNKYETPDARIWVRDLPRRSGRTVGGPAGFTNAAGHTHRQTLNIPTSSMQGAGMRWEG